MEYCQFVNKKVISVGFFMYYYVFSIYLSLSVWLDAISDYLMCCILYSVASLNLPLWNCIYWCNFFFPEPFQWYNVTSKMWPFFRFVLLGWLMQRQDIFSLEMNEWKLTTLLPNHISGVVTFPCDTQGMKSGFVSRPLKPKWHILVFHSNQRWVFNQ